MAEHGACALKIMCSDWLSQKEQLASLLVTNDDHTWKPTSALAQPLAHLLATQLGCQQRVNRGGLQSSSFSGLPSQIATASLVSPAAMPLLN